MKLMDDDSIEAEYIEKLPLFVSIPRSGCNWLQPVLELYFNRHRVMKSPNSPSWMDTPITNPLWMHAHDNFYDKLNVKTDKPSVFLYRDVVDVMYSLAKLHGLSKDKLDESIGRYKRCYDKWALNKQDHGTGDVLCINYDELLQEPIEVVRKIHEHWSDYHDMGEFDAERAQMSFDVVGDKSSVNKKNGENRNFKHPEAGTEPYEQGREQFRNQWRKYIKMESIYDAISYQDLLNILKKEALCLPEDVRNKIYRESQHKNEDEFYFLLIRETRNWEMIHKNFDFLLDYWSECIQNKIDILEPDRLNMIDIIVSEIGRQHNLDLSVLKQSIKLCAKQTDIVPMFRKMDKLNQKHFNRPHFDNF